MQQNGVQRSLLPVRRSTGESSSRQVEVQHQGPSTPHPSTLERRSSSRMDGLCERAGEEAMDEQLPIEGHDHSNDKDHRNLLFRLSRSICREVNSSSGRSTRWLGDILPSVRLEEAERLAQAAEDYQKEEGVVAIIWHPESPDTRWFRRRDGEPSESCESDETDAECEATEWGHCHIYHTCRFNGSYCRCRFLRGFRLKRRHGRRPVLASEINKTAILRWLQYFMRPPRRYLYLALGKNSVLSKVHQIRDLRQGSHVPEEDSADEALENGEFPWVDVHPVRVTRDQEFDQRSQASNGSSGSGIPGCNFRATGKLQQRIEAHNRLVRAIEEFLVVPFYSTCTVAEWINNPTLNFFDKSDPDYKRAVSTVSRKSTTYTVHQIWDLVRKTNTKKHWYARKDDHYMDEETSYTYVNHLLLHQYRTDEEVKRFLQRLFNVCERIEPKRNSMFVLGPPNCGKSWFFDMVCAYYLNVGHVANFVRGEHFPLNDCVERRILMWNEPNIMLSAFDTIKMLAGGDPCPANVKYQGHSVISRTPLLLTGNNDIFPKNQVWSSRMYREQWRQCPMLKECDAYPHPLTYYHLLNEYNILTQ